MMRRRRRPTKGDSWDNPRVRRILARRGAAGQAILEYCILSAALVGSAVAANSLLGGGLKAFSSRVFHMLALPFP